ncbi:MAG: hypothetical protein AAGD35_02205 [Actinomycetota bacterium]
MLRSLVIHDDPTGREAVVEVLTSLGVEATVVGQIADARHAIAASSFDMIMCRIDHGDRVGLAALLDVVQPTSMRLLGLLDRRNASDEDRRLAACMHAWLPPQPGIDELAVHLPPRPAVSESSLQADDALAPR